MTLHGRLKRQLCLLARRQRRLILVWLLALLLVIAFLLASRIGGSGGGGGGGPNVDEQRSVELSPPAPPPELYTTQPTQPPTESPSVPKRLHHYFGDASAIPSRLAQAVHSWANNHKDYDVYYWDSRYLESRLLPGLSEYRQYRACYQAERPTVARLLILLSQGGVLVDPDLISLRDFSGFLDGSACVVAQERPEVAALVYGLSSLPSLRFAACRSGHQFVRLFLDNFCRAVFKTRQTRGRNSTADSTQAAIQAGFDAAMAAYDDGCARRVCDYRDRVVLASPAVFLPVVAPRLMVRLTLECASVTAAGSNGSSSSRLRLEACASLLDPTNRNLPGMMSLAMPVEPSQEEDRKPPLSLDRIGSNVGRQPITNWLLPGT